MEYKALIKKMTVEEKISLLCGKNFWETKEITRLGIKSLFLSDGPSGLRRQAAKADHLGLNESLPSVCYPSASTIANSWNLGLVKEVGNHLGQEAVAQDVQVVLGPGINIKRNPLCGRNFEYYSEDPYLAGKLAAGFIRGVSSNGIAACVKHFAANNQEYRRLVNNAHIDQRTLHEIYLTPFEIAIKEGKPQALMTSYNLINGIYANEHPYLLEEVLRNQWKYKGVVLSDWGGNNDRVNSLKVGGDLEMPATYNETTEDILNALQDGVITEDLIDQSVNRLMHLVFHTTIGDKNSTQEDHSDIALTAAEESIVLLRNEGNILPLDKSKKTVFIGSFAEHPRFQGHGSSHVNANKDVSVLDLIQEYDVSFVGYEKGYKENGKASRYHRKKAIELAKKAEVIVLFIGLPAYAESEGLDRTHMSIPENQLVLIKELHALKIPIVGVLSGGSVMSLSFDQDMEGLIHTFLAGQEGARALLNVLIGKVNPSGKLSESIGLAYEDYPVSSYYDKESDDAFYKEGLYVGYRYFASSKTQVKYPFGFGLSYTTFEYKDLKVTSKGIRFTISNVGDVFGKEIAQLYVSLNNSHFYRPMIELKGFTKVALASGESIEVDILFDEYTFRVYDASQKRFVTEKGEYQLSVGSSSLDIKLIGNISIDGVEFDQSTRQQLPNYYQAKVRDIDDQEFEQLLGRTVKKTLIKPFNNRLVVDRNTVIEDLRYGKGFAAKLTAFSLRRIIGLLGIFGLKQKAYVLKMGVMQMPLRNISRMSGGMVSKSQLDALMVMFNGSFLKGCKKYLQAGRLKRKKRNLE